MKTTTPELSIPSRESVLAAVNDLLKYPMTPAEELGWWGEVDAAFSDGKDHYEVAARYTKSGRPEIVFIR